MEWVFIGQKKWLKLEGRVEIIDLRTIKPIDENFGFERVKFMENVFFNGRSTKQLHDGSFRARISKNCLNTLTQQ